MSTDKNTEKLNPTLLREKLAEIVTKAAGQNMRVTTEEVRRFFDKNALSDAQMDMIYDFLLSRNVQVEGYVKKEEKPAPEKENAETPWSEDEQKWLETYEADLSSIRPEQPGEWEKVLAGIRNGDAAAKRRAAELFLPEVVEEAKAMYRPGVHLSDVIQEGSLHLVLYIDGLSDSLRMDRENVRDQIVREIRSGIQTMLAGQEEVHARDHKLVEKVAEFRDGLETLKEEYGRKVYLDEVADFLNITEDEAEDILRLAGESVSDEEGTGQN